MAILYYCSANHGTRSLFAGSRKLIVINSFEFIFIVFYILDSAVKSLGAYVGEFSEGSEQKKKKQNFNYAHFIRSPLVQNKMAKDTHQNLAR